MLLDEIRTKNANKEISVTIDNEKISVPAQEIIKQSTHFIQQKSLDNVINNPIDVKLFLSAFYYGTESNEENQEDNPNIYNAESYVDELNNNLYNNYVEKGIVKITIKNKKTDYIYFQDNISFTDGNIETQINNNLELGEYILIAEYEGNKYYLPTNINIYFTISKRSIKCAFIDNNLIGHPDETITTNIHLIDSLTGKNINNTILHYSFNNNEYVTQTNNQGVATLNITIPTIDVNQCSKDFITSDESYDEENNIGEYYWDENGNLQPINVENNVSNTDDNIVISEEENKQQYYAHMYPIEVYIINNAYVIENFTQYIIAAKNNTNIIIYNNFENNSIWGIVGNVIDNEKNENAKYGKITLKIDGTNYQQTINVDNDGYFEFNIDTNNFITSTSNNKVPEEPKNYSISENTVTILEDIPETIERNYIKKNGLNCSVTVRSLITNKNVKEGMVNFIVMNSQDKKIYNYVSELDANGKAYFRFDVSTLDTYKIKAHYYGIFQYQDSDSDIQSYTVIEED